MVVKFSIKPSKPVNKVKLAEHMNELENYDKRFVINPDGTITFYFKFDNKEKVNKKSIQAKILNIIKKAE